MNIIEDEDFAYITCGLPSISENPDLDKRRKWKQIRSEREDLFRELNIITGIRRREAYGNRAEKSGLEMLYSLVEPGKLRTWFITWQKKSEEQYPVISTKLEIEEDYSGDEIYLKIEKIL